MTKQTLLYKAGAVVSTVSLLATSFATIASAEVSGAAGNNTTGADSTNNATITVDQSNFVEQHNSGKVVNEIKLNANTGGNSASKNTGVGDVSTGDIATGVGVTNTLNRNVANVSPCGGCDLDIVASNVKTGADSKNDADVTVEKENVLQQSNNAFIHNNIDQNLNTGDNKANKNTGMGSVSTGDVEALSVVNNRANQNWASMMGGGHGGSLLSAGNDTTGADSDNDASIDVKAQNWMVQTNQAFVLNDADVEVNTGRNDANKNTGVGHVMTGDIATGIGFDTEVNANFLAFDGCCDIELGIGNEKTGADSENDATAEVTTTNTHFQSNCGENELGPSLLGLGFGGWGWFGSDCATVNLVDGDLNTGDNATNKNTADAVDSGDVEAAVEVQTKENENVIGQSLIDMPDVELGDLGNGAWWMLWFGVNS